MLRPSNCVLPGFLLLAGIFVKPSLVYAAPGLLSSSQGVVLATDEPGLDSGSASSLDADQDAEAITEVITEEQTPTENAPALTLERPDSDPLLPSQHNGQDLTASEQNQLRQDLQRLQQDAELSYIQGNIADAYRQLFRLLGLSQYLPAEEELNSLMQVGRRAWQDSLGAEAQLIKARVVQLEAEAGAGRSQSWQRSLAETYESLGAWGRAIAHYEMLLTSNQSNLAKQSTEQAPNTDKLLGRNPALEQRTLVNRLAQLSLFNLQYSSAAIYTKQALLLEPDSSSAAASITTRDSATDPITSSANLLATAPSDAITKPELRPLELPLPSEMLPAQTATEKLTQLAYIYEQDQQFAEAAEVQQQILPRYSDPLLVSRQPALQVAIARNQARSGQPVEAIASYQAAYSQAQTLQQFDVSQNALSQLAGLYRSQAQFDDALSVYEVLLQVQDLSYNLYGIADTQASRAEILVQQEKLDQARQAYRQAIYAAKLLGYREAELQQRLDALASL